MTNLQHPFDMPRVYDSIEQYLDFCGNRVIRFWVYRRMFTPLEKQKCYVDQSCYESCIAQFGMIREAIVLPNGDVLLGIAEVFEDVKDLESHTRSLEYFCLSELRIMHFPKDNVEYGLLDFDRE